MALAYLLLEAKERAALTETVRAEVAERVRTPGHWQAAYQHVDGFEAQRKALLAEAGR